MIMDMTRQHTTAAIDYAYDSPTPGQISIIAAGIRNGLHPSEMIPTEIFIGLKECNFNAAHLYGGYNSDKEKHATATALKDAADNQISILASCFYFTLPDGNAENGLKDASNFFNFYKDPDTYEYDGKTHNNNSYAIKGWYLKDEPYYSELKESGTATSFNLINIYNMLKTDPQERPIQVNLVGSGGKITEGEPFGEYLDLFENNFNPNLWSYDLYPITQISCLINDKCNLKTNCLLTVDHETFYEDLNTFHERAKATYGVFWAYVQSMEFISGGTLYPAALESYIRFEAFSALAFGAQGIVYWNYKQQKDESSEVYPSALVDRHGNRMAAWYSAKRVNYEIRQYSKVFVDSELRKWAQVGEGYGRPALNHSFGPLAGITASGTGALVTQLRTNEKNYLVIVSHDVERYQTLDMTFAYAGVIELTPTGSHGEHGKEKVLSTTSIRRQLIPGGYLIYEFKDAYA